MTIKFGTSGWRAIVADEFTFKNVRLVTRAICRYAETVTDRERQLIVGHDSRFLGEQFARVAVEEINARDFDALLCPEPTPTPAISHAIRSERAIGGINFTASHNPPEYNGMKFSTADGAPALPEVTKQIENFINELAASSDNYAQSATRDRADKAKGKTVVYDARPGYFADLNRKVRFDVIVRAGGRYAYDPLWGTGRGYLDALLRQHEIEVETIHDWRDVMFGGRAPEPDRDHLDELRARVLENRASLGLATDGDADRFGLLDANGAFVTPNELIALLFDYLIESRPEWLDAKRGVARSVATSHLVDRVAQERGLPVYETPVGFKFIGELINEDKIIIGGEESAGLSMRGHYPEKDGILACLLAAEAVAARGASLTEQLEAIYRRVGRVASGRIGVRLTPEVAKDLQEVLRRDPEEIGGRRVKAINRTDGVKFIFENDSWLLLRPSGTEPLVRIYAESENQKNMEALLENGRKYLLG
jgi:phosphoglucomutase